MQKKRNYLAVLPVALATLFQTTALAEFSISEFVADNSGSQLADADGFPADWIEIQNPDAAASIAGYYLTDDSANLTKWQCPDVTISANGYLVIFASGKNRIDPGSELHTNFALGAGGEYLALVSPDGDTIVSEFSPEAPQQYKDISYGIGSGGAVSAEDFLLIGAPLTYLVPSGDIGSDWQDVAFDDASWVGAHSALGYGYAGKAVNDDIAADGDIRSVLQGINGSIYIRLPFDVADPAAVLSLTLKMEIDDGFVAYINGTEVASMNAPAPLQYDSLATNGEEVNDGDPVNFFALEFAGTLVAGENILAIQGMNDTNGSSDFVLVPELVGEIQDLNAPPQAGYFETPTPGAPNGLLSSAPPNLVEFSLKGRAFTDDFQLTLNVTDPGAVIHYTTDGSVPKNDPADPSPVYSSPLAINSSTLVRAKAFLPGAIEGPGRSEGYMKLDAGQANFSSDLPVVLLSKFSAGQPPGANASTRVPGFMLIYEPDAVTGRTTLTGEPALGVRGGYRKRGSSSGGFAKYAMAFESWDEFDEDVDISPLGFSPEGDWILNSRFQFDQSLMRNAFLYELSNQVGRWAVKTQFIEIFHDATGGNISSNDYFGVYTFMEKIEPDNGRLDIPDVEPWDNSVPELTGGYVFKRDRQGVGEETINGAGMGSLPLTSPNSLTPTQEDYLEGYLAEMNTALDAPSGINSTTGKHFSEYMDVSSFVDNFWLNVLAMDPDWGRLSQYFYKDREGLLHGGPIWDYDRTMGSDDGRDDNPRRWDIGDSETWYDSQYPWFGKLFGFTSNNQPTPAADSTRPDVMQQIVDRWYELRSDRFSQSNMDTIIDSMADEIREAQARSFVRWTQYAPGSISGQNFSEPGTTGWERDVSHLKGWLKARSEWIDEQFFIPPTFNQNGGVVDVGFQLTMNSNDATVYYTLDGSDPRAAGGGISAGAIPFDGGPVTSVLVAADASCQYIVPQDASLETTWYNNGFDDGNWLAGTSGLGFESPGGGLEPEVTTDISSVMKPPSPGIRNASGYFRFEFEFDNAAAINSLLLEMKYDDAFVAYLNGVEIARSAKAPATVAWDSGATGSGIGDGTVAAYVFNSIDDNNNFDFDITAFKSSVVNGTNVLAIQGMNSGSGGSDFLVKPYLSVNHTVVSSPISLTESANVVARAYDGQQWGGPTRASFVVGADLADGSNLVISEIMYNPIGPDASEQAAGFIDGDQFEYIELLNISANPVDLGNVSFTGGVTFNFFGAPVNVLNPGQRVLIVADQAAFTERYGAGMASLIAGEFADSTLLANGGERLALSGANGTIRDFSYNDRSPWPESPDGDGPSMVLIDPTGNPDHGIGTNWRASAAALGSPGMGDSVAFTGDPSADGDRDGLDAFAEYAFGTSDSTSDGSVLEAQFTNSGGSFSVTYPRNLAADDAVISVEVSTDLNTWMPPVELGFGGEIHNGDGTATVEVEFPSTLSTSERFFVRLRVTSR